VPQRCGRSGLQRQSCAAASTYPVSFAFVSFTLVLLLCSAQEVNQGIESTGFTHSRLVFLAPPTQLSKKCSGIFYELLLFAVEQLD
jgi:hypothetical protein